MEKVVVIDGSQGEGGGQILRTSVGLAAALGLNVKVTRIRAGRPKPGLRAQHLAAVRAAAAICGGRLEGDAIGAGELVFRAGAVQAGHYRFDIGTAGSTVLLVQTILPALMLADGESQVTVTGGTHNPMAPCFEYLRDVFGVLAAAANLQGYFELERPGFYPGGGGEIQVQIRGIGQAANVAPLRLASRGRLKYIDGVCLVSRSLPRHILRRQTQQALRRLQAAGHEGRIEQAACESHSPGTAVFLRAVFARTVAGFSALGARGKRAEQVADEAVEALLAFLATDGHVDAHAADQLITIAALCPQESRIVTERVTDHLLTNAQVIRCITGREVLIEGRSGECGAVTIREA